MSAPPQARPNASTVADEAETVFQLKLKGWPHDRIAAELGISHGTVANRLKAAISAHVAPLAQEWADHREAELGDLFARSYAIVADPGADTGDRLKAIATCTRVNESRRKLRGADAPESLLITHEANLDLSGNLVADVLNTLIPAVAEAAGSDAGRSMQLEVFAGELARWVLTGREGEQPVCPPARRAITAGSPERRSGDDGPPARWTPGGDAAGGVMAALAAFEDEFGPLGEGDDRV